jgi:Flp pilus assembly protein TadG
MRTAVRTALPTILRRLGDADRGQALVEFSLAVVPFLILLMGVLDLGRGIYIMNGTSEAARDIARATVVHPWDGSGNLGWSTETQASIATQRNLIPGLTIDATTDIVCVDAYDVVVPDNKCKPTETGPRFVKVHVTAPFAPITPFVSAFGSHNFESTSRMEIP